MDRRSRVARSGLAAVPTPSITFEAQCQPYGAARIQDAAFLFQDCVRRRAYTSVMAVRDVTKEQAMEAIDRVFDRCYNDLEPFGRRFIFHEYEIPLATADGHLFGFKHKPPKNLSPLEEEKAAK